MRLALDLSLPSRASLAGAGNPLDTVYLDFDTYSRTYKDGSGQPYGVPSNGFYFINNVGGKGSLVNGVNFTQTMKARQSSFPLNALIEWNYGNGGGTGIGTFAYGYPGVVLGSTPYGDADGPFNEPGPWPSKINQTASLKISYDLTFGGNLNSFNALFDFYVTTASNSSNGAFLLEISYFPRTNPNLPFVGTAVHTFASIGKCRVGLQGTQACFYPCDSAGTAHRAIDAGTVDMLELAWYCVTAGWVTGEAYFRGGELGCEVQVPAAWNSAPYAGSMLFNTIPSRDWTAGTPQVPPTVFPAQPPTLSGATYEGGVASCSTGTWNASPTPTYTYQWKRNGSNIGGATSSSYTLASGDSGQTIICEVTATNAAGAGSAISGSITPTAAVAPSNSVAPVITNPFCQPSYVVQGQTLSVSSGTWSGNPTPTYTYQWRRGGANISGATSNSYTVQAADDALAIDCVVTATNVAGSANATSTTAPFGVAGTLKGNYTFTGGAQGWGSSGGFTYSINRANLAATGNFNGVNIPMSATSGKTLRIFSDLNLSAGSAVFYLSGSTNPAGTTRSAPQSATALIDNITIPASMTLLNFQTPASATGWFDNVGVVERP